MLDEKLLMWRLLKNEIDQMLEGHIPANHELIEYYNRLSRELKTKNA